MIEGMLYLTAFDLQIFLASLPLFLVGIPAMGWQISTQTALQRMVDDRLRGRWKRLFTLRLQKAEV